MSIHIQISFRSETYYNGILNSNRYNVLLPVSYSTTDQLSLREQQVIRHLAKVLRNKEIALLLYISKVTVNSHLSNIFYKLEVTNRTSMLNKVLNMNILP